MDFTHTLSAELVGALSADLDEKLTRLGTEHRDQLGRLNGGLMRLETQQKQLNDQQRTQGEDLIERLSGLEVQQRDQAAAVHTIIRELETTMRAMVQEAMQ